MYVNEMCLCKSVIGKEIKRKEKECKSFKIKLHADTDCFRTHNELTMYPLGKYLLAPSERGTKNTS
jgi:hypothetical protein